MKKGTGLLYIVCLLFSGTFLIVLVDGDGIVGADVPFRVAESKCNVEQIGVNFKFYGGDLHGYVMVIMLLLKKNTLL